MKHYHKNPRQITKRQMSDLQKWLVEFGDLSGIVHNIPTDEIIGGNQRSEALPGVISGLIQPVITERYDPPLADGTVCNGYYEIDGRRYAYRGVNWDDKKAERANLIANKAGGTFDMDILANQFDLPVLLDSGFEERELIGFDFGEPKDAEPQTDRAAELLDKWQVKTGDLWQIGEHRLICGDCTDAAVVSRVMGGEKAELLFTSPPYSDMREYTGEGDLSLEKLVKFIPAFYDYCNYQVINLGIQRKENEIYPYWDKYISAAKECGYKLLSWNIWNRENSGFSMAQITAMFAIQHEWIFVFGKARKELNLTVPNKHQGESRKKYVRGEGDKKIWGEETSLRSHRQLGTINSIGTVTQEGVEINHSAMFPVALVEEYVKAMTDEGDIVAEPFDGSGTTLVACQNLSRRGRAVEISPAYCSVTLQRMADAFPELEIVRIENDPQD